MTKDRRQRRVGIDILVNKYIEGEGHVCRAVNVSTGGMLLYKVFEPNIPHDEVSVEFQLPGSQRVLRADGITLAEDSDARKHGVRFTRIAEEDKLLLERFLRGELHEEAAAL